MTVSLRARLFALWLMSLFGSLVVAVLILGLFRQTASAHRERDRAVAARACQAIAMHYDFYTAGMDVPPDSAIFDAGLRAVLLLALRRDRGVIGGIQPLDGPPRAMLGSRPQAWIGQITTQIGDAIAADRPAVTSNGGFFDRTTIATCPLGGALGTPVANLAAYTVLQSDLLRSSFTRFAFGGLAVLLATLLASAWFLARLVLGFSQRLAGVEAALQADRPGTLALTGEAELDRLITALNAATTRLDVARARIAESERLAALGRMAAGLAHEIRNPLGAIRLRAESGRSGDATRAAAALDRILVEAARLETLTARLLGFATAASVQPVTVSVDALIRDAIGALPATGVMVVAPESGIVWTLDPVLTRSAIENLLRNAVEACGEGGTVTVLAAKAGALIVTVSDTGPGVDKSLGDPFEPFVTGRPDGIGLGLAMARDMIRAQGGTLVLAPSVGGAVLVITLPEVK
ncbi:ATP-binding protein [Acidiphilium acidophilum]|uniref:sensor histidine kinase n=1 Tax=Acidiphilium acidophilum TaxID=76588 RepID=UPI002E8E77E3|nr:ATP-binding protein [Acidiphilium acidophilum]